LTTLRLVALLDDLTAGAELGAVHLDDATGVVTFTGQPVAQEQFESLARNARRQPAEMVKLIAVHGWSNSKVAFVAAQ
jgi:hypothetical protein